MPEAVPHFHGLACYYFKPNRHYRVYVRSDELVFIWAGKGNEGKNLAMGGAVAGGAVGALVGYAVQKALAGDGNAARQAVLDSTPLDELIHDDPRNLRAAVSEFTEVRIAPRSPWHAMQFSDQDHQGLLYLKHRTIGKLRLGLASLDDLQAAAGELPRLFGPICRVELAGWSPECTAAR